MEQHGYGRNVNLIACIITVIDIAQSHFTLLGQFQTSNSQRNQRKLCRPSVQSEKEFKTETSEKIEHMHAF